MADCERTPASVERATHTFDRHIRARLLHLAHPCEHLSQSGAFEVSVVLLVDRHAANGRIADAFVFLRSDLYVERTARIFGHCRPLLYLSR